MKKLLFILMVTCFSISTYAQDDMIARIEYENAEQAYNAEQYDVAITHIDKVEKKLKTWSCKVSYLKIMTLSNIVDYMDSNANYVKLEQEVRAYMKYAEKMGNEMDMDKFRNVYNISQNLEAAVGARLYYSSPEYFAEKGPMRDSMISMFRDHKFLPGMTYDEVKKYYPETATFVKLYGFRGGHLYAKSNDFYKYKATEKIDNIVVRNDTVISLTYTLASEYNSNIDVVKEKYADWVNKLKRVFGEENVVFEHIAKTKHSKIELTAAKVYHEPYRFRISLALVDYGEHNVNRLNITFSIDDDL